LLVRARTVEVPCERHPGRSPQTSHQPIERASDQLLTDLIHAARPLLERIVLGEDVTDGRDDLLGRRRDQQRG
jgi:hypothetical protein